MLAEFAEVEADDPELEFPGMTVEVVPPGPNEATGVLTLKELVGMEPNNSEPRFPWALEDPVEAVPPGLDEAAGVLALEELVEAVPSPPDPPCGPSLPNRSASLWRRVIRPGCITSLPLLFFPYTHLPNSACAPA